MAQSILDNYDYGGKKPNFERDLHKTLEAMKSYSENYLPPVFIALNQEDGCLYIYNVNNEVDEVTGKWRKFKADEVDLSEYMKQAAIEQLVNNQSEADRAYTDEEISKMKYSDAIVCDEEPSYSDGIITYFKNGEVYTTDKSNIWFYYATEDALYQTIFIEGEAQTIKSGGGVNFDEFIKAEDGAAGVKYEREGYPLITTAKQALDKIFDKLDYVEPKINSFTVSPAKTTYEVGEKVEQLTFTWAYNKDVTSQTLTGCEVEVEDRTAEWNGSLTSGKTFTLSASDGENCVSKSIAISFMNKFYYGSAAQPENYDSDFILGLSKSLFASSYKQNFSMTVGGGEYGYIAFPASFGRLSSVFIGGFETTVDKAAEIAFTNASGGTVTYAIYRTGRTGLGTINVEIK